MSTTIVLPGQSLAPTTTHTPGAGVHIHNGQLISSLVGQVVILGATPSPSSSTSKTPQQAQQKQQQQQQSLPILSVHKPTISSDEEVNTTLLPEVGSEIIARVTRISARQATVGIFVVGGKVCGDEFQGVIRVQDVRATEQDKLKIFTSFRPGDIVRAQVISLGDQSNYYLTTASNHLGVIMANSEAGDPMYPINWKEMKSTRTGIVEERKVAKPF